VVAVAKVWVLETHTKGTGANMVPLDKDKAQDRPAARARDPVFVAPKRRAPAKTAPEPKKPSRFRVVDLMTDEVLAEDAGTRETVAVLAGVRSVVDVRVYMWNHRDERWRLLTQREQKTLWDLRGRAAVTPSR
jgi:hypothetical protein